MTHCSVSGLSLLRYEEMEREEDSIIGWEEGRSKLETYRRGKRTPCV